MRILYFFIAILATGTLEAQFPNWTPWSCSEDQFVYRRGPAMRSVQASYALSDVGNPRNYFNANWEDYNAIARHPKTGVVHAWRNARTSPTVTAGAFVLRQSASNAWNALATPNITPNNATPYFNWGGGDITDDGYWILFNSSGYYNIIDLTDPSSPTYGTVIKFAKIDRINDYLDEVPASPLLNNDWLSGDVVWSEKDQRLYFFKYRTIRDYDNVAANVVYRLGWIDREDLFTAANGSLNVPMTFGAPIVNLPRDTYQEGFGGSAMGIDRQNNIYIETNGVVSLDGQGQPTGADGIILRIDAQYVDQQVGTIPVASYRVIGGTQANGSDGFSCMRQSCQRPAFTRIDAEPTQVGISTLERGTDASWVSDTQSSFLKLESASKGFVPTRMTDAQMLAISTGGNAVEGMVVFNTTQDCLMFYNGTEWICGTACND